MKIYHCNIEYPVYFESFHQQFIDELSFIKLRILQKLNPLETAKQLGSNGLYSFLVPHALGGALADKNKPAQVDVRSLCLIRETLGQISPLADAIFAVQGLGTFPIVMAGTETQKKQYLPDLISGRSITGFALTEPEAGSDAGNIQGIASKTNNGWELSGEKTLISNAPIADFLIVFASTNPSLGKKGISAFIVPTSSPGLTISKMATSGDHPLGRCVFQQCFVHRDQLLGNEGDGFRIAMSTLDTFRTTVGAAANGMATHALDQSIRHVCTRKQFGKALIEQQMVKSYIADMATQLAAARLLVAQAAWKKDTTSTDSSVDVAMAKMFATESGFSIIDRAVQLHGGKGVLLGSDVEALYREIRPLRIYEGTTEIQKLIIAKGIVDRFSADA